MFENWFKTVSFTDILDDFYTLIKQYDLKEQRDDCKIFYSLNSKTNYWLIRMDCTKLEDDGLFPYKISYGVTGHWENNDGRLTWRIGEGNIKSIEGITKPKSFNWWQKEKKKIDKILTQIRHDERVMMKYSKKINLIGESLQEE